MDEIIFNKLQELADFALERGDPNTAIILNVLMGAKHSGMDGNLAGHVQKYVKDVLIPHSLQEIENRKVSKN